MTRTLTILILVSCLTSPAACGQHILCGVVTPGEYNYGSATLSRGTGPVSVLTYEHTCDAGPCSVTVEGDGQGGPVSNGCSCRPRVACAYPENMNSGVVFRESGEVVGYVEFHDGTFLTSGGLAFGWAWAGVASEWFCYEGDWPAVRLAAGVSPDIALWEPKEAQ